MDNVITGRITKLSGIIVFVNDTITMDIEKESKLEVEIDDLVVGYIKKKTYSNEVDRFRLIAKTKKQKIKKTVFINTIAKFIKKNRSELGIYSTWSPLVSRNIFSIKRNGNLVLARHIFMFLNVFMTNKTLSCIAKECNLDKKNHATVIYGKKQILNKLSINPSFAAHFQGLINDCVKE